MIDAVISLSIRHRGAVILLSLAVGLAGAWALATMPIDAIPDLSENQVIVFADWMGHSPREVEDQITSPLAGQLRGIRGARVVRTSSDLGFAMLSVIFEDDVNVREARRLVAERLAGRAVEMPEGVTPYLGPEAPATGQIYWYTVEGPGLDLGRLRAIQDWSVKPQLASVPGVAEVASVGGFPPEYQVNIDPARLRAHKVTLGSVVKAVARSNSAVGGHVIEKGNAEYVVRGVGWLGSAGGESDPTTILRDLEDVPLGESGKRLADVAKVALGPGPRRGVLEKDGSEVVGGVVLMAYGENPREVTKRLRAKIKELQIGLPAGVKILPFYDRTPLIEGAVSTVAGTVVEAMVTSAICVLLVLLHARATLIIAATLPLAALAAFAAITLLRWLGIADVQANIMSLAGIAISVGVLVDSSIVMAENALHALKGHFGDNPVRGDVRAIVGPACKMVGRPIVFSVAIMLLSFLPVFVLGGIEGKMFRPLAITKSLSLAAVAVLAITLVPALCTLLIRGRLRGELASPIVRGAVEVYRPVLGYMLKHPGPLALILGLTFTVGLTPIGSRPLTMATLACALIAIGLAMRGWPSRLAAMGLLVVVALAAESWMTPIGREFMTPLDEGMVMDMPISVPRASITESGDDLKVRDMILCRFPEVEMVVGKAGRAETPTDPAPLDMIETMVNLRPADSWPHRKLATADARRFGLDVLDALIARELLAPPPGIDPHNIPGSTGGSSTSVRDPGQPLVGKPPVPPNQARTETSGGDGGSPSSVRDHGEPLVGRPPVPPDRASVETTGATGGLTTSVVDRSQPRIPPATARVEAALAETMPVFDAQMREFAYQRNLEFLRRVGPDPPGHLAHDAHRRALWRDHLRSLDAELLARATPTYVRLIAEDLLDGPGALDPRVAKGASSRRKARSEPPSGAKRAGHHGVRGVDVEPIPELDELQEGLAAKLAPAFRLSRSTRDELTGFGGELDRAVQMPGWANVWTMPIQNRVDMLSTGVNTAVGVRVLGRRLEDVVGASEALAVALKGVPGAADVVADPIRGKGYLEIRIDRRKALRAGVSVGDLNDAIEAAMGGVVATKTLEGRERHPVRVRYARASREDEESVRNLLIDAPGGRPVPLSSVADVRIVEGPATIKGENGLLRNYVRLNVRGRDVLAFVADAKQAAATVPLPPGVFLEWTGQFEHEVRARHTLAMVVPVVVALIFLILYKTYDDLADAALMLLAVPGAIAGGVLCQWALGTKFSVTVLVGYIACFGMATSTGIIMLVYLRDAVARAGGLESLSLEGLRVAVLAGAAQRLRPKLLTEGTTILGLAPILWATGVGAEVIRPMAAPVLGGLLVADEVIDLLLPVLFFHVRRYRWRKLHATGGAVDHQEGIRVPPTPAL